MALELASRPGWTVVSYFNDPETPHHLERVRRAFDAPPMHYRRLARSPLTSALQKSLRIVGMFKNLVMRDNAAELNTYDVIFSVEDTVAALRKLGAPNPRLIYCPHGAGDRARGFVPAIKEFDLVLTSGPKVADRMQNGGFVRPDNHAVVGSVKLETVSRIRHRAPAMFSENRPTVLYNAHKDRNLTSWKKFIEPMLSGFAADRSMNLIVAPHVKMFRRTRERVRETWRARSSENILVDPSSDRLVDMTYVHAADIYIGDVSSQVYEFLTVPRPCVFLNAANFDWQDDPDFAHWHLGDVVNDPADLMAAVRAAPSRHPIYRERQETACRMSLGGCSVGAASRAAETIVDFLARSDSKRRVHDA